MLKQIKIKPLLVSCIAAWLPVITSAAHAEDIPPIDCMIEPNIMVEISSPVTGVLDTLLVDRSDEVKQGQIVATLKSDVEQVSVKISQERLKLSEVEYKRAVDLYRKKVITLTEKDKSDNEKKLSELDVKHAKANLNLRKIKSPIDGVVVKRYSVPGEFVESEPILKLAQLDPLKIEVVSPVSYYGKIVKGMRAKILPDFGDYQDLVAEVVVVDKVVDAASGTFGVRLELANKDHAIPSGLKCKVHFMPEMTAVTTDEKTPATTMPIDDQALICATIGPYKKQETLNNLLAELDSDIKHTALRTDTDINTTYLVVSEDFNTPEQARKIMQSMKAQGVTDLAIMKKSSKNRIALGLYSRHSLASDRVESLQNKGYQVHMKPVRKAINTYWADIVYPSQSDGLLNNVIPETLMSACEESIKLSLLK